MKKLFWIIPVALFALTACTKDNGGEETDDGANSSSDEIGYIECSWNGIEVVKTPQVVNAENLANHRTEKTFPETELTEAAYYVSGKLDMKGTYKIKGGRTVSLILCDGAELKMNYITVDGEGTTLKIFGQEKGTGKLTIEDPDGIKAAIGPGNENGGNVVIHGGVITANGGTGSAAIGSGYTVEVPSGKSKPIHFGRIEIYGGTINAKGGSGSAGIGGGSLNGNNGIINIYGGDITAEGGGYYAAAIIYGGAGIGGCCKHSVKEVNIYGGNIRAKGGTDAAGIGAGENVPNGEGQINIYGGTIVAEGAKYGAGIGGGDGVQPGPITISGGEVYAYAGTNAAGIGGGEGGESGNITITGGTVRAYGDRTYTGGSNSGYGSGIGSGQAASVNTIIIKGGDIAAYGGEDGAGIGTGEEYGSDINSGTIEIHGGKVWAEGKGYGAGIGAGEDATFGVLGISGGRVDAHAGGDCGPWSGGIGAYHKGHGADDNCHIGWAGWERIYIGKGMRLWTYSPNVGYVENVTNNLPWWNYVHQRPQVAFGECDHPGYTEATCPYCHSYTLQLK